MEQLVEASSGKGTTDEMASVRPVEPLPQKRNTGRTVGIVIAVLVLVLIIVSIIVGMVTHPFLTATIRDIAIIVLALITIVIGAFIAILMFQLQSLIVLLREEIYPILRSLNDTASTVRGTTTFVSDAVVSPMITAASYASAVKQTFQILFGRPRREKSPQQEPTAEP